MKSVVLLLAALSVPAAADEPFKRVDLRVEGRVNHVLSRDLDGDGLAELLAIVRQGTDEKPVRKLLYWKGLPDGPVPVPTQLLTLPDNAVVVDVCDVNPAPGAEIVVVTDEGLSAFLRSEFGYSDRVTPLLELSAVLPFPDEEDAPFYQMCHTPAGGPSVELWVPGGRGVTVVTPVDGKLEVSETLLARPKAYHQSGDEFRGPRARRDFAVLTMLVMPKLIALDADKDGDEDLFQVVEDTVALYLRDGGKLQKTPAYRRNFNLRNATDRAKRNAVMDVMLGDVTGDGLPDAVVTKLAGGMTSLKTETRVYVGEGARGFAKDPITTRKKDGYATPLMVADVDGDNRFEVLEPEIKTSPVAVAGMLVKQRVDADLRVLRSDGKSVSEGKDLTVGFALDTSGAGGVKGGLPLLGQDVNGDGRMDIISMGSGDKVELYRGTASDPPWEDDPSWSGRAPSTLRGDWYVPYAKGPASIVVFFPDVKGAQGTMLLYWNTRTAKPKSP